ncbi:solute carrier family 23 member 1-like [Lytechinus variegatus]|uniref:solute carrier family 23 member 1-like n=1 Tax=Lytechinus variegatus TaxID=7654 RepID=UPI001BB22BE4|nr:solute carrier family 23 member 1-like [Lytechinus variegatus]
MAYMSQGVGKRLGGLDDDESDDDQGTDYLSHEARKKADQILKEISGDMMYRLEDRPPWYTTGVLAFQHFLTMFSGSIAVPIALAPFLCIDQDITLLSKFIATIIFVSGVQTFLQTTMGIRLPMVQGPSYSYALPLISMMDMRGECPDVSGSSNTTEVHDTVESEYRSRMQEVQGALFVAAFFEILLGFGGIIGILLRFIGPLTIAPTIALIGFSVTGLIMDKCSSHWGISILTMALVLTFSQYIERFKIPCLGYSKTRKCHFFGFPMFRLFPIFLSVVISWIFCWILTVTDVFPNDQSSPYYQVRTDSKSEGVANTPWFYFPYPGQWGGMIFSAGGVCGMMAGTLASVVESIGDYYALAGLSGAPRPPVHAINRGIGIEGIGGLLSALWGSGVNSTSYSTNVAVIGLTKVSSRFVVLVMSGYLIILAVVLKFAAIFAAMPDPIVGGVLAITIGMVSAVGLATLHHVNMSSPRNLFIVGFSFILGLALPQYIAQNPDIIATGLPTFDQILTVLLRTSMFVGGFIGFVLDNTIPGTREDRGLKGTQDDVLTNKNDDGNMSEEMKAEVGRLINGCYDMPFGMPYIRDLTWTKNIPFSPTFTGFNITCKCNYKFWKRLPNTEGPAEETQV